MAGQGNTTMVGLGWPHQQRRKRAIAALQDGTPCRYCGKPMYRELARFLDLDHVIPRMAGGADGPCELVHRSCNRRAGAIAGNRMRARKRASAYTRW